MKMYFFHQKIKLLKKFIKHRLGDLSLQANGDCGNAGNIQAHCGSLFQTFSHTVFGYSLIVNMQFNNLALQFLSEVFFFPSQIQLLHLYFIQTQADFLYSSKKYLFFTIASSVQSLSRVQLFAITWTAGHQASLYMMNSQSYSNS